MSASVWPTWLAIAPPTSSQNATLDAAATLTLTSDPQSASTLQAAGAQGTIANQNGAGGVNWYTFTLSQASDVQLATLDAAGGAHLDSVLSLYDSEAQDFSNPPINYNYTAPPYDPLQHRLMVQVDSQSTESLDRELAAGTYYVAVSGHGDSYFNPFLADSGYAGSTGSYRLLVTANPLPNSPGDGPTVLAVDTGLLNGPGVYPGNAVLTNSPFALYVDFSSPIDPNSVSLQQSLNDGSGVQLTFNPTGQFGNGFDSAVLLNGYHYAPDANELQLQPAAPFAPGFYRLTLAGNANSGNQVLMALDGASLGQNSANPAGADFTTTFQIAGSGSSDDTASTAQNLGNITTSGIVQTIGAIGNDSAYNAYSTDPNLTNPAAQVNLYHFRITGAGNDELSAEVFAGRIGSTLAPAISLFRVDPHTGQLVFVTSQGGSGNQTLSSDGQYLPLATDPVLDVGLVAGDYYLAVSSAGNMPDQSANPPGTNGNFDPNIPESGINGSSTGAYVLNLLVQPAAPAPHVVAISIPGGTLTSAPTQFTVTFDSPVNLIALANQADSGAITSEPTFPSVFVVEPNGEKVYPGFVSYDTATNQATFVMLDRLPNGINELHLSGANGLTGLGGNPLVGNDFYGDFVASFAVADPAAPADPLNRTASLSNTANPVDDLGALFPTEVQNGVTVAGTLATTALSDNFTVQLSEPQEYQFSLDGPPLSPGGPLTDLPNNMQITITDGGGNVITPLANGIANVLLANLTPGIYTVHISRSPGDPADPVAYDLLVTMLYTHDNPPPLSVGATPVLQIRSLNAPRTVGPVSPVTPIAPLTNAPSSNGVTALASRADLAGGVTIVANSPALATATPLEVQGLSNGPIAYAVNSLRGDSATLSYAVTTLTTSPGDFSSFMDFFSAAWSEWQARESSPGVASTSTTIPEPMNTLPLAPHLASSIRSVQSESASEPIDLPAVSTEAIDTAFGATSISANETKRSPMTLIAAIFSTALAAFLVWGRTHRAPALIGSLKARKTEILEGTVKLAD